MSVLRASVVRLIIALFLSMAIWAYVSYSENPDTSASFESMPVHVENLPSGLVIVDQEGIPRPDQTNLSQVNLVVRTDQETLQGLRQNQLRAFVDLADLLPGENQVQVQVEPATTDVRMSDFSSISPSPEFLSVRLDRWITHTVPLSIEVVGNLPFSFEREEPVATYRGDPIGSVQVEGPESQVERVVSANTVANIEQLRASYVSLLHLDPIDSNKDPVKGVNLQPPVVNVRVPIRSVVGLKRVPVLGNIVGSPASGYMVQRIESDPALINISGSSGKLDAIENIETSPINISGVTGTITREAELNFPRGVSSTINEGATVIVTVHVVSMVQPFLVQLPFAVEVRGANEAFIVEYQPRLITLDLQGDTSALSQIESSMLVASADVEGFGPGSYEIVPTVALPEGITLQNEVPPVSITLQLPPTPTSFPTATTPLSPEATTVLPVVPAPITQTLVVETPLPPETPPYPAPETIPPSP